MQELEAFLATIHYPPNPFRELDNSLSTSLDTGEVSTGKFSPIGTPLPSGNGIHGKELFRTTCAMCHTLPLVSGTNMAWDGQRFHPIPLGPNGEDHHNVRGPNLPGAPFNTKVPSLRNLYERRGMFNALHESLAGFGYRHDGTYDSLARFAYRGAYNLDNDQEAADLVAFLLSLSGETFVEETFDDQHLHPGSGTGQWTHALVGKSMTFASSDLTEEQAEQLSLLKDLARSGEIDVVVRWRDGTRRASGRLDGEEVQWNRRGYRSELKKVFAKAAKGRELTLMAVPTGSGTRLGLDRDLDGRFDADEQASEDADEYPSERIASIASALLRKQIQAWFTNEPAAIPTGGRIPLLPKTEVVYESGDIRVERAVTLTRDDPRDACERARELWGGAVVEDFYLAIDTISLEDTRAVTEANARILSVDELGAPTQINARWRAVWTRHSEYQLELKELETQRFEVVHARRKLFHDITDHVLGPLAASEELGLGIPAFVGRTDRLFGNFYIGNQGVAVADVDGDGLDDIYILQQGGLPNRLLLQVGDGSTRDASRASGLDFLHETNSALFLDLDGDGDQDLCAAIGPALVVARNNGEAVFHEQHSFLASDTQEIMSLAAADADGDGDLDVYATVYSIDDPLSVLPIPYHDARNGPPNVLWRNEGELRFTDATEQLGLDHNNDRYSYAALWEDFDSDGDLDLYVVNDFGRNNLYRNEGGRYRDVAVEVGADDMAAGMGITCGDIDRDGDPDLLVSNMYSSAGKRIVSQGNRFRDGRDPELLPHFLRHARGNTLLLNRGDGTFQDATLAGGAADAGWAWGAKFIDLNSDGSEDIYSPNGWLTNEKPDDL